jgi:hypothetical protein
MSFCCGPKKFIHTRSPLELIEDGDGIFALEASVARGLAYDGPILLSTKQLSFLQ